MTLVLTIATSGLGGPGRTRSAPVAAVDPLDVCGRAHEPPPPPSPVRSLNHRRTAIMSLHPRSVGVNPAP